MACRLFFADSKPFWLLIISNQYLCNQELQISGVLPWEEWKRCLYSCSQQVTAQSKSKIETSDQTKPWTECPGDHAGSEGVYSWLDRLLLRSWDETNIAKLEWVAAQKISDVHLETMEEAENKDTEPKEIGYPRVPGLPVGKYTSWLLENCRKCSS